MIKRELYFFILLIPHFVLDLLKEDLERLTLQVLFPSLTIQICLVLTKMNISITKKSNSRIESKDDFVLRFSPVLHFSKDLNLLSFQVSAGAEIARFAFNDSSNYIIPVTNLILDFDETLSLNKRISNNAKVRFSATFDIGQHVGTDLIEADLISYTYLIAGFDVRYNHSPKLAVSTGTNYELRSINRVLSIHITMIFLIFLYLQIYIIYTHQNLICFLTTFIVNQNLLPLETTVISSHTVTL